MPSEEVRREIDRRMEQLTATLARPPASVQDLLDTTFTGVSSAGTVTVRLDFRGALRGVHIRPDTLLPGDEQALCAAIMQAHADATETMFEALSTPPAAVTPESAPRGRSRRPHFTDDDSEDTDSFLRRLTE